MIGRTYLEPFEDKAQGVVAEFYASGALRSLCRYTKGEVKTGWLLELEDSKAKGTASRMTPCPPYSTPENPDYQSYANGEFDSFDAFSDNSRAQSYPFEDWVREWIEAIYEGSARFPYGKYGKPGPAGG